MFPKIGVPQNHPFNRVFHYIPSILGYPYFWNHPYSISPYPHLQYEIHVLWWLFQQCRCFLLWSPRGRLGFGGSDKGDLFMRFNTTKMEKLHSILLTWLYFAFCWLHFCYLKLRRFSENCHSHRSEDMRKQSEQKIWNILEEFYILG